MNKLERLKMITINMTYFEYFSSWLGLRGNSLLRHLKESTIENLNKYHVYRPDVTQSDIDINAREMCEVKTTLHDFHRYLKKHGIPKYSNQADKMYSPEFEETTDNYLSPHYAHVNNF